MELLVDRSPAGADDPARGDEALLAEARARARTSLRGREFQAALAFGGGFVVAAVVMATSLSAPVAFRPVEAALLVVMLAVASRVEFELGTGCVVPTQAVLVPMLFLLPPELVPCLVAAGYGIGAVVDHAKGRRHLQRIFVLLASCWHCVPPALLLAVFGDGQASARQWPLYTCALAAQFAADFVSSAGREWLGLGIPPRRVARFFAWVYAVDGLLAPVGFVGAEASKADRFAFLLMLAPIALLGVLAHERRTRIERAQAFQDAYDKARNEARLDALTGLANRRAWSEAVTIAQSRLEESGAPASVVLLDVDLLKHANDSRGHDFGDRVLRRVSAITRASVREHDFVARIGGDEIAVLLADADEAACSETVARLKHAFATCPALEGFSINAAVGFATATGGVSVAAAHKLADSRMYVEKERDRLAGRVSAGSAS